MVVSDVAQDGAPVAVYLVLPASPKFDPVVEALPGNGSVLDLGCGTSRLSNLLAELGYEVVAVDESPAMLAHVSDDVEVVRGRIEGLDLGCRFDVVAPTPCPALRGAVAHVGSQARGLGSRQRLPFCSVVVDPCSATSCTGSAGQAGLPRRPPPRLFSLPFPDPEEVGDA